MKNNLERTNMIYIFLCIFLFSLTCNNNVLPITETQDLVKNTNSAKEDQNQSTTKKAYTLALGAIDQYIYQPALSNFTQRSVMDMEITKLCALLSDRIKITMVDFVAAGKEAKAMQLSGADKKELREKHAIMADIFYSLRSCEPMVRDMYPKLNKLFDQLIELRENLDYSISDTDIIVKDPANNKSFLDKVLGR